MKVKRISMLAPGTVKRVGTTKEDALAPRTSQSHPLNVSWLFPNELHERALRNPCEVKLDMHGSPSRNSANPSPTPPYNPNQKHAHRSLDGTNFALSSCPGKKVRLNGAQKGKPCIARDLQADFDRISSFGITTVICCLNDSELSFLGASWPQYKAIADKLGISVVRIPIIEGWAPSDIHSVDNVISEAQGATPEGGSILCHCRGGMGRAGLIACCYLIRNGYCTTAANAIAYVRHRRSMRAIETRKQEDYIHNYCKWWKSRQAEEVNQDK
jgi:protein-tyrosine phosphatase